MLAAGAFNLLAGANWQRGGGKGPRPKPVRPGESRKSRSIGRADRPEAQVVSLLDRIGGRKPA